MTTPQMDWLDAKRRKWLKDEHQRWLKPDHRNATPWLPPDSRDPHLENRSWRIGDDTFETEYVVVNGPSGLAFTYDDLRDALVDLGRYVVACNAMHRSMETRWVLS